MKEVGVETVLAPLRVGVIGCGNISRRLHIPTWVEHPELGQIVAVADPGEENRRAAGDLAGLGEDGLHADAIELIARPDVDAVDVCTPQHLRRDILIAAAEAGKHIFCEKPLAATPADAAAAIAAAQSAGVTIGTVHTYLWLPEIRAARAAITEGRIGEVRTVIVNHLGVVYEPGAAATEANWRHDPRSSGGGVLIDMIHAVYVAEDLLGEPLQRVSAWLSSADPGAHVEDTALCRFETATKAALVNIGWGVGAGGIEIAGSAGRISIRYRDGGTAPWAPVEHVTVTDDHGVTEMLMGQGPDRVGTGEFPGIYDSFQHNVKDFVEAARGVAPSRASGADGLRILEATIGAYESGATGRIVELPLDSNDPVVRDGVLGVPMHPAPAWSPVVGTALFRPLSASSQTEGTS